jgi:hypothetical protein
MTQKIIDVGANANDGTGEPLRQAFTAVNDNFTQIWEAGPVGSQVKIYGNVVTTTVTNLGLTLAGNGIGNITANSTIVPGTTGVYDIGAPNNKFQYIYGEYLVGDGSLITGIVANTSYNNSNVAAFLPTYTGNLVSLTGPVRTTANVIAGNIITSGFLGVSGNISGGNITGNNLISSGYISAVGNITTTGNIAGNYLIGNGAFLTGITVTNISAAALTGTTLSSNVLYSSLQAVGNLLYLNVDGNVTTTGRFIGSGAGLTNIPAANIVGQVSNALTAGTVTASAQPNITSVGTLTSITATGNVAGNYFIGNGALLTGIATGGSSNANALTGTTLSSNVIYSSLQVVGNLLYVNADGNITTTGRFIGSAAGLTNIPAGNITGTVANATYAVTAGTAYSVAGANVSGTVANATYATTAGSATTAITATTANTANSVAGANVFGVVANATYAVTAGSATTANTAATVTTAAQPNITSVGTLTSVSVTGNATAGNIATAGQISAIGNVSGNYFIGNGALLTGITVNASTNANALTGTTLSSNVIYSSLQVVGNLLYVNVDGNVTTTGRFIGSGAGLTNIPAGNVTGTVANATYATSAGTATTANIANLANSVAGANVSGVVANATYATTAGSATSATTAGTVTISAQPNITSVGTLISITATGNATAGNILTGGQVSAAGNIFGNYIFGNGAFLTGISTSGGSSNANALVGTTLSSNVIYSSLQTVGNLLYVNVDGNVTTTGRFIGSAAGLTNIPAGNVTGTVANATYAVTAGTAYSVTGANVSGAVSNATYATSAGSATTANTANVANSVAGANVSGAVANATYAVTAGSATTATSATTAGTVTSAAQPNITSVGTLTLVAVTGNATAGNLVTSGRVSAVGNISGNYILGNGAFLTGISTGGSSNANALTGTTLSSNVIYSSLQVVGNLLYVNVDGNVTTTGRFIGSAAGLTNIPAGNITGTVANATYAATAGTATTATSATTAVTVTGNAQPNITSVGTLTSVSVTGNTNIGNLSIGQANLYITNTTPPVLSVQADSVDFTSNIDVAKNIRTFSITANSTVSAFGNVIGGNLVTAGNASAQYYVGNGRFLTGITATDVGNLTNLTVIGNTNTGNLLTGGIVSAVGNIKTSNYFIGNGALLTGIIATAGAAITNGNSNVTVTGNSNVVVGVAGVANVAVFTTTGLNVAGNITGNAILSDHYFYANGAPVQAGITYTAAVAPPVSATVGDQWYDTTSDVLYEYISDGISQYWVDVNSPAFAGGVVANVAISGTMLPDANTTYNIGSSGSYFRTAYIQTVNVSSAVNSNVINTSTISNTSGISLQTNGTNAIEIDSSQNLTFAKRLRGNAMPVGSVIQTVMSSSLGGSITNSTSYSDISYATVTITPSSATSKILILATGTTTFTPVATANVTADTQLVRSPTISLQIQNYGSNISGGGIGGAGSIAYSYQDNPGTTSPVTYKLQQKISNSSSTLTSTNIWLIALEIAA